MTLKEFKEKLNEFPEHMDDYEVFFGESIPGERVFSVIQIGDRIELNFF